MQTETQIKQGEFKRCLILAGILQQKNWQLYVGYAEGIKVGVSKTVIKDLMDDGVYAWVRKEDIDLTGKSARVSLSLNRTDFDPMVKTVQDLPEAPRSVLGKRWSSLAAELDPKSHMEA